MPESRSFWKRALTNDVRFSLLLAFLLMYIFLGAVAPDHQGDLIMQIFFTAVLIVGAYSAMGDKRFLVLSLLILLPTVATTWISLYFPQEALLVLAHLLICLFLLFICVSILRSVMKEERVTFDKISAALCSYILLGVLWSVLYSLLELLHPGSFFVSDPTKTALSTVSRIHISTFPAALYFSFTTLTTLGFGDITPITPTAQHLVVMEALIGQIFLVVLVARLVGLEISHSSRKDGGRTTSSGK